MHKVSIKNCALKYSLGLAVLVFCLSNPLVTKLCRADDSPFEFDTSRWKSFERYNESRKKGLEPAVDEASKDTGDKPAEGAAPPTKESDEAGSITPPAMTSQQVAAPTRPINTPVMPGLNKGFNVQVNSTEDERAPIAQINNIETTPTIALPKRNWQTPKEATQHLNTDDEDASANDHQTIDVRMSFLPNTAITPIPSPDLNSTHGRKTAAVTAAKQEAQDEKKSADPAACAAVDAYKKRQIEAIESDRQTLAALQKAISQLGLQKELSFLANNRSNLNQADSSAAKVDTAPSLSDLKEKN